MVLSLIGSNGYSESKLHLSSHPWTVWKMRLSAVGHITALAPPQVSSPQSITSQSVPSSWCRWLLHSKHFTEKLKEKFFFLLPHPPSIVLSCQPKLC
ncbi:hypothetical protein GDO81_001515 [Engystomops pustulosus]|uniref:Uncharacterized protein n=1 Tax=Engystomops pustulosus TaxID=76066 RepID=A0AAV7DD74_ENGPU|nr:hypothetical protein GDO81_001515 [Engystomops pustulosus]